MQELAVNQGITGDFEIPMGDFGESTALDDATASALDGHSEQVQYNH